MLLLTGFLLLGMATVICLKAVSDSVFLSEFDARLLPWVDLAVTGLVALTVNFYLRWTGRAPLTRIIVSTQGFLIASLLLLALALHADWRIAPALIYLWVGVFAVLIPSQAWSLAGAIFTTRQAKRVFALIGSGGILGAALGGNFAGFVGPRIGAEAVLAATALFTAMGGWAARAAASDSTAAFTPPPRRSGDADVPILDSFREVRANRYLLLIALAIFVSTIAGTLIKYEFKALAQAHFEGDRDALTSFTGYFYGYIAVFSFVFHTLLSSRLLRWVGLGGCLFILPAFLGLGFVATALSATIFAAVFARAADQGFRHSIDRASVELLYVPVDAEQRTRVKSFLDMAVSRFADGLASLILVGLLYVWGGGLAAISTVGLAVTALWVGLLWKLRREYVATLRSTIERRDISAEQLLSTLAAAGPSQELREQLQSSDQKDVEAALGWIQLSGPGPELAQLRSLLTHPSATIRRKTMRVIEAGGVEGCGREIRAYLTLEADFEERRRALEHLAETDEPALEQAIDDLMESRDFEAAALGAAVRLKRGEDPLARETLESFLSEAESAADPGRRAAAARLAGFSADPLDVQRRIGGYLRDRNPAVVAAALVAARESRPPGQIDRLIKLLGERGLSGEARKTLAAYGDEALEAAAETLRRDDAPRRLQRQAARLLGSVGGRDAARTLLACLRRPGRGARREALRALARIRSREGERVFDRTMIEASLEATVERWYETAAWVDGAAGRRGEAASFFRRALRERMERLLDETFTLLSLLYPQREMRDAYSRIRSGREQLRANALEFLDSRLIGSPLRPSLLPAVEAADEAAAAGEGRRLYGLPKLSYASVLRKVLEGPDPWLQACACAAAAEAAVLETRPLIARLAERPGAAAEEARVALMRLSAAEAET